jgi:PPK2 family polyphosphate:nucleotide phosphotransferase
MADKPIDRKKIPDELRIAPGEAPKLADKLADRTLGWTRDEADGVLKKNLVQLSDLQYKLYADRRFALLIVLQAIDGGGKDGTVRHVMSAFNPQGCTVTSFKGPSAEELRHDYLWRIHRHVPPRGEVGVFNRSHYEDVLIVRVDNLVPKSVWSKRYDQINAFERMLAENDVSIVKLFLHISKDEQKRRFQGRLEDPRKHWKFEPADLEKRKQWDEYRKAFEAALTRCNTSHAPWYVIPADHKWFRDLAVSQILVQALEALPLKFPEPSYDPTTVRIR